MSTSNAQRFLAKAGVDDELALEMYMGLVLTNFRANTLFWNAIGGPDGVGSESAPPTLVQSKTITGGKSHQFVLFGDDTEPERHTPGTELLGQQFEFDEGSVTIDKILVAHKDVPLDQIQLSHFDVLRPVAVSNGRTLATTFDKLLAITAVNAANTAAVTKNGMTIHSGGNAVTRTANSVALGYPNTSTGAGNFSDDVATLAYNMDLDNVPETERYLIVSPYIKLVLAKDTTLYDRDYSGVNIPNSYVDRVIGRMHGFTILWSNHLPSTAITSASLGGSLPSKYQGTYTVSGTYGAPVAVALAGASEGRAPVAYVAASNPQLGPIYTAIVNDERRNTQFLKAQMMAGAGVLYPPSAGVIQVKA